MKFSTVLSTVVTSIFSVDALRNKQQRHLQTPICSCAPRVFSFALSLDRDCSVNTLEASVGISNTNCVIVNVTDSSPVNVVSRGDDDEVIALDTIDDTISIDEILQCIPWIEDCTTNEFEEPVRTRELQTGSPIPTVITSIQWIELNSVGRVINIDNTQSDLDAVSGDTFAYVSKASDLDPSIPLSAQLDNVPKTAVLFMVGSNDDGDDIRGRFVWEYTNGCGKDEFTIIGGEEYGWVSFDQVDGARPEFCPALNDETTAPTYSPSLVFPTASPQEPSLSPISVIPTLPPTLPEPSSSPITETTKAPTYIPSYLPTTSPQQPSLSPVALTLPPSPEPSPNPVTPTESPTALFFPTQNPTPNELPTPIPTTLSPIIVDNFPTTSPVEDTQSPSQSPSEFAFPTETPSKMGEMPTTQRPVLDQPTTQRPILDQPTTQIPVSEEPTVVLTPFPSLFYGDAVQNNHAITSPEKEIIKPKTAKRRQRGGKGSKNMIFKGKSGKSHHGGQKHDTLKEQYRH